MTNARRFESAFYATGLPITEAYWADVKVAGQQREVLLRCFERRCLTYTPGNDPAWQVEAGTALLSLALSGRQPWSIVAGKRSGARRDTGCQ
ncbi:MAG: hypothetical protein M3439_07345 [Chloroflexota bacterium]|nr:hypothetical protein [Chloroflexota bacterium]